MNFNEATLAQIKAARPDSSTWLAANAGSGKTRVLTDRVALLLLNGVEPQHILCLTYTKAAAAEMQNRLFKRLGQWAMLPNDDLQKSLEQLGVKQSQGTDELRNARTLFARAIETPGGLKIQTIHSFCSSLLRRFPLEAGVSPQFTEVEERDTEILRSEIVEDMADGPDSHLVAGIAQYLTGDDLSVLTKDIASKREQFITRLTRNDLLVCLDKPTSLTQERLLAETFEGNEKALIDELLPHLRSSGTNDQKAANKLALVANYDISALPILIDVFVFGSGKNKHKAKIDNFPTKPVRENSIPHLMPQLNAFMERVEHARDGLLALDAVERATTLHQFAYRFLERYEAEKQQRGWLDFDDLIIKAKALLNDPAVAAWVLFRIDGGIDHILVDEAQDTSPRQWDVIERLADEFYSGASTHPDTDRTLFVVGDKKQSIYSFQGADPKEFDRKRDLFSKKFQQAGKPFQSRSLAYSFRSSSAILRVVDGVFDPRQKPSFTGESEHLAFAVDLPGRVDIWPAVQKTDDEDDRHWTDPVDRPGSKHHSVLLAQSIAARIKELTEQEHYIPDKADDGRIFRRRIRAGDFLILVQSRTGGNLFPEIIRACKAADLPIAGADRLKVGAEIAVKDLAALLSFLATPDDDLALATALKSPIFGWTEQQLFKLAAGREKQHLWQAFRDSQDQFSDTAIILHDLRAQVDFLRPFDLLERILTRHQGRKNLLSRLGSEAEDGINAMLSQALAYERTAIPSLTGFLQWMQTDDLEIKRQIDNASDQIRVMTVHGAKGLEAPIVILPDTGSRQVKVDDNIIAIGDAPFWKTTADKMPEMMAEAVENIRGDRLEERQRLLYVALTRAEKWLMIAAAGNLDSKGDDWYQTVQQAMGQVNATKIDDKGTLRFSEGNWDTAPIETQAKPAQEVLSADPIFTEPVHEPAARPTSLSPSELGGAKALPGDVGEDLETALSYGSLVHKMLEVLPALPPERRGVAADEIGCGIDPAIFSRCLKEAENVMKNPNIKHLFAKDTLAEVPVTARINTQRLHGSIDRLIISETHILAVDYKTNRMVPENAGACPEGILRQLGAYAHALKQIYPDHVIETAVLWTATCELMMVPYNIVISALQRSPYLDVKTSGS